MNIGISQWLADHGSAGQGKLVLSTLGPPGTSSEMVARSQARTTGAVADIRTEPSFEAAAASVIAGEADLVLVAGAYGRLNGLLMNPELRLLDGFVHNTPDYLVAAAPTITRRLPEPARAVGAAGVPRADAPRRIAEARPSEADSAKPVLFTHASPLPLLGQILPDARERFVLVDVASTSLAAQRARAENAFAFTNAAAAAAEGLTPLTPPAAITMLWLLFGRARGDGHAAATARGASPAEPAEIPA